MSESQVELNKNRTKNLGKFLEAMPETAKQVGAQMEEAYKAGAIDTKTKRLMAMALALGAGCRNCVLGQAMGALDQGATRDEFLETLAVVISMRGTTGVAESLRIIQLLDELEVL
ncbi:MAG: carboxymuconolactone decarboxylase family protein [Desulfobacterales bacterium]